MVDNLSYLNHEEGTQYHFLMDLPYFFNEIPDSLKNVIALCDRRWFYEFMGNVYLHYANDLYCGQSFSGVVVRVLYETVFDSMDPHDAGSYEDAVQAVRVFEDWINLRGPEVLRHFERIGIPKEHCDYASLTCNESRPIAQWIFFRPPF